MLAPSCTGFLPHSMSEMSPLLHMIVRAARLVVLVLAAILAGIIGVFLWQHHGADGFAFRQGDKGFLGLMIFLLGFCLYLARGMAREMRKPSP